MRWLMVLMAIAANAAHADCAADLKAALGASGVTLPDDAGSGHH